MTLVRLALGVLAVTLLFVAFGWATGQRKRGTAVVRTAEALVLTLFAALWFGSLGRGGWLPVFLLVGLLASGADRWLGAVADGTPLRALLKPTLIATIRYGIAGGLLSVLLR